jgi:hypothetical protein
MIPCAALVLLSIVPVLRNKVVPALVAHKVIAMPNLSMETVPVLAVAVAGAARTDCTGDLKAAL